MLSFGSLVLLVGGVLPAQATEVVEFRDGRRPADSAKQATARWSARSGISVSDSAYEVIGAGIEAGADEARRWSGRDMFGEAEATERVVTDFLDARAAGKYDGASLAQEYFNVLTGAHQRIAGQTVAIITVTLDPASANLFLNGDPTPTSPHARYIVPVGDVRVRGTLTGYQPCVKWVTVEAEAPPSVDCALERIH